MRTASRLLPFLPFDWPKEGHVTSWVDIADIRFDSTTCAWDETFDFHFALYIYVYKWQVWFMSSCPCPYRKITNDVTESSYYTWRWSTGLWSLLGVINTQIKWDWRQTTWEIRAGYSVYDISRDQFKNYPVSNIDSVNVVHQPHQ